MNEKTRNAMRNIVVVFVALWSMAFSCERDAMELGRCGELATVESGGEITYCGPLFRLEDGTLLHMVGPDLSGLSEEERSNHPLFTGHLYEGQKVKIGWKPTPQPVVTICMMGVTAELTCIEVLSGQE
jgi:hypothetical protein